MSGSELTPEQDLEQIVQVLDRAVVVDVATALAGAFAPRAPATDLQSIAFGLDASVFLRLADRTANELADLLISDRTGPLILPSQAIQEFWKNHDAGYVETVAQKMKKALDALAKEVAALDTSFDPFKAKADRLMAEFLEEYGHMLDQQGAENVQTLLKQLARSATLASVPRTRFAGIALNRERSKTPPGFRDPGGDGDFYTWVEFLHGLRRARAGGRIFTKAVLLTEDTKKDWSRRNIAHPVLVAEMRTLLDVPFELWTMDIFRERVKEADRQIGSPQIEGAETSGERPPAPPLGADTESLANQATHDNALTGPAPGQLSGA